MPVYAGFTPAETRQALRRKTEPSYQGTFMGARKYVLHTFATTQSALMKRRVSRYMIPSACPTCDGKRLKREALAITFEGFDIGELSSMPLRELALVLQAAASGAAGAVVRGHGVSHAASCTLRAQRVAAAGSAHAASPDVRRTPNLSQEKSLAAQRIAHDMLERVTTLDELGLGYLSLDRGTPTLSAGELQRLRLATQIRSNLFGVIYVLDEPTAGLHPSDGEALLKALTALKHSGNSVFVVEHDLGLMRAADWIVDVGPDAGEYGGQVLYSGPPTGLAAITGSHTAAYLFGRGPAPARRRRTPSSWLRLEGVTRNNLRHVNVDFPLGCLTAVTGISGSGKSSLVSQALVDLVAQHLGHEAQPSAGAEDDDADGDGPIREFTRGRVAAGAEHVRRLVQVDQKPIGRTPRSNLATYTGLFDHVRRLFAATPAARARRFDAGRFSFNVAKGRCETCEGEGFVNVELMFMPSVYAPCPTCHGARYNETTLKIRLRDQTIADVLQMTVDQALASFADDEALKRPLLLLQRIGLGYLRLGQPATELSGGEAQRIKLATELQRAQRGKTLYVLDEPTTGLHPADVDKLLTQLNGLVDAGNTVVVVEHDMLVVGNCDWVIDMGPGAGGEGGQLVAFGPPEDVAAAEGSRTASHLASELLQPGS